MTKSPDAFRTISEVAEALDVPAHVLRFWETRFAQVKPVKRGGGRRYYRPDDVRLLRGIRGLLYDDGMTIKGVQKILREQGVRHVIGLGTVDESAPLATPRPKPRPAARPAPAGPAVEPARVAEPVEPARVAEPVASGGNGKAEEPAGQRDLFAEPKPESASGLEEAAEPFHGLEKPVDRPALRRLVADLEALRREMVRGAGD
jgi:DNA-binding transcriptional MerR regulator